MDNKVRNSSFEVLRIVAIIFIVLSHLSWHGYADSSFVYSYIDNAFNRDLLRCLNLGNLGVDVFVMISGYFLIESNRVFLKKVLKLFTLTWFYGIIITVSVTVLGVGGGASEIIKMASFPLVFGSNWFVTVYLILYTFHPYINRMLMYSKTMKPFIIIMALCFIWWVFPYTFLFRKDNYCNPVIAFFIMYVIGAYLRLYGEQLHKKTVNIVLLVCIVGWIGLPIMAEISKVQYVMNHVTYFYSTISLITIVLAACLVLAASRISITSMNINWLATFVFPIYLISDNYWIRIYIYDSIFHCKNYADSAYLPLTIVGQAAIIIIVCIITDLARRYTVMPLLNISFKNTIQRMYTKLDKYSEKLFS